VSIEFEAVKRVVSLGFDLAAQSLTEEVSEKISGFKMDLIQRIRGVLETLRRPCSLTIYLVAGHGFEPWTFGL
jgi:hypothetical protein